MNKEELIEFEKWVAEQFNNGNLRSPVHLSGGNEEQLIKIFQSIKKDDWVFTTYRSHYHALLKGVNKEELKQWILDNKSIHFMNKKHKIFSSAIVGGTIPIALGVAYALKIQNKNNHVWCFIGDMAATTGIFQNSLIYAYNFGLPITFIIEDNGLSTDTPTHEVWGITRQALINYFKTIEMRFQGYIIYYNYQRIYPHYGTGKFVEKIWEKVK